MLTPCMFDRSLLRHIHQIVALHYRHPTEIILQSKVDWKLAYRRLHNASATAVSAMVLVGSFLLVAPWLTFGDAPALAAGAISVSYPATYPTTSFKTQAGIHGSTSHHTQSSFRPAHS
jgi:hypothetical protein